MNYSRVRATPAVPETIVDEKSSSSSESHSGSPVLEIGLELGLERGLELALPSDHDSTEGEDTDELG